MTKTKCLICCLLIVPGLLSTHAIYAKVRLPPILSSNMVLQRNTSINLWGWADAGEDITITTSWLKDRMHFVADKTGNWSVEVQTSNSKEAQSIKIKSKESDILLENILFGEVWLCSGQSNMEQPVTGKFGQPTIGSQETIANAHNVNLRLFTVMKQADTIPRTNLEGSTGWELDNPESVKEFSAVAYFFGQKLQQILDVPVGMIHTSWGGSDVRAWMSKEALSTLMNIDLSRANLRNAPGTPTVLFNAMINPLIPYTIKGALWYQGERNVNESEKYKILFPAMVKDWRRRWNIGDFPFYFVQIAPWSYDREDWVRNDHNAPLMREAQMQCLDLIPNSGIAVTLDIGDEISIHPPKKKEVADRLLYNALNKTYGYKAVDFSGPVMDSFSIRNDTALVTFKFAENGLFPSNNLEGFEISGADKVFYPANATIDRKGVFVKSEKVKNPVAVRYGWHSWVQGTLFDTNMLPATSFRTDVWDNATFKSNESKKKD